MIHIITGAPCSGKSTYVEKNSKEGDLIVDFDKIAFSLGSPERHNSLGLIREAAFEARAAVIDTALKTEDAEAWIIHTIPTEYQLQKYEHYGAEFIHLEATKEECLARAEADGRPQSTIDAINKYFSEEKKNHMDHLTKSFKLKADEEAGKISGFFSTYDVEPDSYGDIIAPGAFTETLAKRAETGHPFPICFNHDFDKVIGVADKIEDTEKGPHMEGHFLDTPQAQEVREMVKSGAIYQFSFAYDVLDRRDPTAEEKEKGIFNVLTKVELFEISVVTVPANQNAVVTDIKAAEPETKAGKRNSKADEAAIKQIISLAQGLLGEAEDSQEEEEAKAAEEVKPEVNEASEEQKANDNLKARASAVLERIKSIKEDSI